MEETLSFKFYNMAGAPGSGTSWFHYRIIDNATETDPANQYEGDFWGLYMTIEQPSGRFLDRHGLADGNTYKIHMVGSKTNQGPTQVSDFSDVNWFISEAGYNKTSPIQPEPWWDANINLGRYYSFRAISVAVNNIDLSVEAQVIYYHNPETDKWWMLPWDLDMTWPNHHHPSVPQPPDWEHFYWALNYEVYNIAYQNRVREIRDLLYNADQGWKLIDEFASVISDGSDETLVEANRALWDYHPRIQHPGKFFTNPAFVTPDFAGWVQYMKEFILPAGYGGSRVDAEMLDSAIPDTPVVTATGDPCYPINDLTFETTAFSDPQGVGTFAALEWRIGEITDPCNPKDADDAPKKYEIETVWESGEITDSGNRTIMIPATSVKAGHSYRVRCRMKDDTGRCSHWSAAHQFIAGEPLAVPILSDLRITELMYDPAGGSDYEFIELKNTGPGTLDLANVYFSDGIDFAFGSTDLSGTFDVDEDGFAYSDDTFNGTSNPGYAEGTYEVSGGYVGGGIRVYLGPGDIVSPASGGWSKNFSVGSDGTVTVNLRYRMKMGTGYESGEFGEAILEIDGTRYGDDTNSSLIHEIGNGNSGGDDDYGWMTYSTPIPLTVAGNPHTITVGAYNNDATSSNEWMEVFFDEIVITSGAFNLNSGQHVLVVRDQGVFESLYGTGLNIAGQYSGNAQDKLSNGGERVKLADYWHGTIAVFDYNDSRGWPMAADGGGHSLVPQDWAIAGEPNESLSYGRNWRASTYINGSPGADDPSPVVDVVINEFMAHTDYFVPPHESNDWIELYNSGANTTLNNWYLSDDKNNLNKWAIPGTFIGNNSRVSFDQVNHFNTDGTGPLGFGLNKDGEQIYLSHLPGPGADRVVDCVRFKGQENNVSLGRYPDGGEFWFHMPLSQDSANVMPNQPAIVIDEIMYHPTDTNEEYLELYNPTGGSVTLEETAGTWRLRGIGNNDYYFPSGFSIPSDGRLIMVGFDPVAEPTRLDDFETTYGTGNLTPNVDIVGPWDGNLSNGGERVALEKPQESDDPCNPGDISWIIVDEVIYFDQAPWPTNADGLGDALQRLSTAANESGNDPTNWTADAPSPGSAPSL